ncbi:aminoacyl-histidine dipeptidase [Sesbania bispinosa]|nr:aminoacyl-histidine dipeptidase [Sesbania bispinosa]
MAKGDAAAAAVGPTRTAAGRGWTTVSKGEAAEARRMADAQRCGTAVGREVVYSGSAKEVPVLVRSTAAAATPCRNGETAAASLHPPSLCFFFNFRAHVFLPPYWLLGSLFFRVAVVRPRKGNDRPSFVAGVVVLAAGPGAAASTHGALPWRRGAAWERRAAEALWEGDAEVCRGETVAVLAAVGSSLTCSVFIFLEFLFHF